MAIPEARPLPPASGLLDTASFVATVDSFFTNRFAITAKGAHVLTYHHFQSDPFVSLIKTSVLSIHICFLLSIFLSACYLCNRLLSWGYRDAQGPSLFMGNDMRRIVCPQILQHSEVFSHGCGTRRHLLQKYIREDTNSEGVSPKMMNSNKGHI